MRPGQALHIARAKLAAHDLSPAEVAQDKVATGHGKGAPDTVATGHVLDVKGLDGVRDDVKTFVVPRVLKQYGLTDTKSVLELKSKLDNFFNTKGYVQGQTKTGFLKAIKKELTNTEDKTFRTVLAHLKTLFGRSDALPKEANNKYIDHMTKSKSPDDSVERETADGIRHHELLTYLAFYEATRDSFESIVEAGPPDKREEYWKFVDELLEGSKTLDASSQLDPIFKELESHYKIVHAKRGSQLREDIKLVANEIRDKENKKEKAYNKKMYGYLKRIGKNDKVSADIVKERYHSVIDGLVNVMKNRGIHDQSDIKRFVEKVDNYKSKGQELDSLSSTNDLLGDFSAILEMINPETNLHSSRITAANTDQNLKLSSMALKAYMADGTGSINGLINSFYDNFESNKEANHVPGLGRRLSADSQWYEDDQNKVAYYHLRGSPEVAIADIDAEQFSE